MEAQDDFFVNLFTPLYKILSADIQSEAIQMIRELESEFAELGIISHDLPISSTQNFENPMMIYSVIILLRLEPYLEK